MRSAYRNHNDPANRNDNIGFRCARAHERVGVSAPEQAGFHGVDPARGRSPKPGGGRRAGRDARGRSEGSPACRRLGGVIMQRVIDAGWHNLADGVPPAWASAWGQDRSGVYVAFTVGGVTQRLRWIPPGRFWMGSPEDEEGRYDTEGPRHEVTIAAGFWLFDTACTEALWEAVTGTAPQPQRGPLHPVTDVSWDDAQSFIERINVAVPGLDLRLPSEAEWEYACRAQWETPYCFGTVITKEQVCFDSDEACRPTAGACARCTAMSGNGARIIGTGATTGRRPTARHGSTPTGVQRTAFCAAGLGPTRRATCAPPSATSTTRRSAMTTSAFAAPEFSGSAASEAARAEGREEQAQRAERGAATTSPQRRRVVALVPRDRCWPQHKHQMRVASVVLPVAKTAPTPVGLVSS